MTDTTPEKRPAPAEAAEMKAKRRRLSRVAVRRAKVSLAFLDEHRRLDARTWAFQHLERLTGSLTADLGGDLSHQQRVIVRLAARQELLVEQIDGWLFEQHPINRARRCLIPVVKERQALVEGLVRMLTTLGLERRAKRAVTLAEIAGKVES